MDYHELKYNDAIVLLERKPDIENIYVELTNSCNFNCEMCFRQSWDDKLGMMPYDDYMKLLDQFADFPNLKKVIFEGIGEPLLHPRFLDIVKATRKAGYDVVVGTNGYLMDEKIIKGLIENLVEWVIVSIDAVDLDAFENIRNADLSTIIKNIQKLNEMKKKYSSLFPKLGAEFVIMRSNYKELPKLPAFLEKLNVIWIMLSNVIPTREIFVDEAVYHNMPEDFNEYFDKFKIEAALRRFPYQLPRFELNTERKCDFIETKSTVIRWDGEVAPCYRFLHTYKEYIFGREKQVYAHSFGNVKEESLIDIWTGRDYTEFRWKVKNAIYPSCTDCPLRDVCELTKDTIVDCWGMEPSCADCLWSRRIAMCPNSDILDPQALYLLQMTNK